MFSMSGVAGVLDREVAEDFVDLRFFFLIVSVGADLVGTGLGSSTV